MNGKLLICIPAYNEEQSIGALLDSVIALPLACAFDILVVNDGSADRTEDVCRARKDFGVKVITHIYNIGYGGALKTAYKYAADNDYEYVIQLDADGQHDICNVETLYNRLAAEDAIPPDIVLGSRFLNPDSDFRTPFHKRLVIGVIRMLIRLTTGQKITDPTSGLQGLSRRAFCYYSLFNNFDIEYPDANVIIQMILNGFIIEEIAAAMHPRVTGESMHSGIIKPVKYIVKMMLSIMSVYLREMSKRRKRMKNM